MTKSRNLTNSFPVKEYEKLAGKYIAEKNYDVAIDYLSKLIHHKENLLYYTQIGFCYYETELFNKSLNAFIKAYNYLLTPLFYDAKDSEKIIYNTISFINDCYFRLKQYQKSIDFCKTIDSNHKGYVPAIENLAVAYLYLDDIPNMNFYLDLLHKRDPKNKDIKVMLSLCYLDKGDCESALNHLDKLVKKDLDIRELYKIITTLTKNFYFLDVLRYCEMYIEIIKSENTASGDLNYGEILDETTYSYFMTKNYEKTIEYFEQLKEHHDLHSKEMNYQYLDYLLPFATISYLKLKKYDEILVILDDLVKQNYGYYVIYLLISIVYYFKKDFDKAIEYANKVVTEDEILIELFLIIIKNSKNNNFENMKNNLNELNINYNNIEPDFMLITNYCFSYIFKNENNETECEKYNLLIKNHEENEAKEEICEELLKISFDEEFYNNLILMCLDMFEL